MANVALDVDVRQEVHFHLDHAVAFAGFTAPAFDVEREASRLVAALAGLRRLCEEIADGCEQARVRRGVGARGATDGALVYVDDFVERL